MNKDFLYNMENIEIKIQNWFKSKSGASPSNTEDFFSSEFIDSLSVVSLILFCENEFSIKFDEDDFQKNEFRTINGLTNIILDKLKIV